MPTNGIIKEKKNGHVVIQIDEDMSACKGCAAHALCGKKDCSDAQITLKDRSDLNIGDKVVIEEKDNILIKTSLLAYGIPMLFFIAGIFLGLLIPDLSLPKEFLQFISGCLFMVLGGLLGRWLAQKLSQSLDKYFLINVNNQQ